MVRRGTKPQKKVSTDWSPQLAYAVGLITTDGCLSKDGRHIDFTSNDHSLVETFRICLNLQNRIGRKISGFTGRSDAYRVQFGDVNFYNWLIGLGLKPRKSRILGTLKIPDKFFFDFLRGCFDGDGTIYSFWDKRWADSFMFYISFSSASKPFLLWLQRCINRAIKTSGHIATDPRNTFQLKYAKADSLVLFPKMHYADTIPHLKRKLSKAKKIFRLHRNVVLRNKLARVVKLGKHASLRG